MKKIMTAIGAMFILLTGVFTSCDWNLDDLTGPENKWEYKTFEYDEKVSFDCYCYYSTSEKEITMGSTSDGKENKVTLKKGLNVVIVNNEKSENKILDAATEGKTPFVLKCFEEGQSYNIEDDEGATKSLNFKKSIWSIIYLANSSFEQYSDTTFPLTKSYTYYESVENLKDGFNFEKVLKKMAANKLLEILEAE